MMKNCLYAIVLCLLAVDITLNAQDTPSVSSTATALGNSIANSNVPQQLIQSFGYCPDDYTYSMQLWNDLSQSVTADLQKVISVQGAKFNSSSAKTQTIPAFSFSDPSAFANINICHGIVHLTNGNLSYSYSFDVDEKDKNTYFFHTFQTSEDDSPQGEFMGPGLYGGPYLSTKEFDGVFFNKSPYEAQLSFKKNGQTYSVSLESSSFNLLSSDSWQTDSIRSSSEKRSFDINVNNNKLSFPVNSIGLGDSFYDPTTTTTQQIPLTYTYEIYQNQNDLNAVVQGFNMGNHNQLGIPDIQTTTAPAVSQLLAIRDINPVDCSVWCQSLDQYQTEKQNQSSSQSTSPSQLQQIPYILPGSLWATYQTDDWKVSQQLSAGSVTNFDIIRPQKKENIGYLYIFSLNTTDSKKANQFLTNVSKNSDLTSQLLKTTIDLTTETDLGTITAQLQKTCQSNGGIPSTCNAIINDQNSGVQGALLLVDTFVPYGGGTKTPRYYKIPTAILLVDTSFSSIVTSNLDPKAFGSDPQQVTTSMASDFNKNIIGWLSTFNNNLSTINASQTTASSQITLATATAHASELQGLVPDLTDYVRQKGLASLFTDSTATTTRIFSDQGIKKLYLMLFGPLSLSSPPVILQPGINAYLGLKPGELPKGWPSS